MRNPFEPIIEEPTTTLSPVLAAAIIPDYLTPEPNIDSSPPLIYGHCDVRRDKAKFRPSWFELESQWEDFDCNEGMWDCSL